MRSPEIQVGCHFPSGAGLRPLLRNSIPWWPWLTCRCVHSYCDSQISSHLHGAFEQNRLSVHQDLASGWGGLLCFPSLVSRRLSITRTVCPWGISKRNFGGGKPRWSKWINSFTMACMFLLYRLINRCTEGLVHCPISYRKQVAELGSHSGFLYPTTNQGSVFD